MYTYYIASSVEKNKSVNFLSRTSQNISILETHEIDRIFVLCDFVFALLNSFKDDCIRATNLTNINTIVVNILVTINLHRENCPLFCRLLTVLGILSGSEDCHLSAAKQNTFQNGG